jgi:hypothetical protein
MPPTRASQSGSPSWATGWVQRGSPIVEGRALHGDGSTGDAAAQLDGYSIIQAGDVDEALRLIGDHPYLAEGREYSVEILPPTLTPHSSCWWCFVREVAEDVDGAAGVAAAQGRAYVERTNAPGRRPEERRSMSAFPSTVVWFNRRRRRGRRFTRRPARSTTQAATPPMLARRPTMGRSAGAVLLPAGAPAPAGGRGRATAG